MTFGRNTTSTSNWKKKCLFGKIRRTSVLQLKQNHRREQNRQIWRKKKKKESARRTLKPQIGRPILYPELKRFLKSLPKPPNAEVKVIPAKEETVNQNQNHNNKIYTLVLDLDETLVHSSLFPQETESDFEIEVKVQGIERIIYVKKRPNLDTFLTTISRYFEIVIFTASPKKCADAVLNKLDPESRFFQHRLYRDCCYIKDGKFVKNLNILGRDLDKTVVLDDSPVVFGFHPENALWIPPWTGTDPNDRFLLEAQETLREMANSGKDLRIYLKEKFEFQNDLI